MKLRDFIEHMFHTVLNNLYVSDVDSVDDINEKDLRRITMLTKSALTEIHTRFPIKESIVLIQSLDWKANYEISSEHSVFTGTKDPKYVVDSPFYPFKDDIINIIRVTNEVGEELPLNDSEQWASVFTPRYNVLQITHPGESQVFEVTYQANHAALEVFPDKGDTLDQVIDIPPQLKEVLALRVAIDFFSAMSGQEETAKSQMLTMKYESACDSLKVNNTLNLSNAVTNTKLMKRGFP